MTTSSSGFQKKLPRNVTRIDTQDEASVCGVQQFDAVAQTGIAQKVERSYGDVMRILAVL